MKKTLFVLMLLLLIPFGTAACSSDNTKAEQPAEAESMADYTSGTPWMCIDLEGVVTPDTPADVILRTLSRLNDTETAERLCVRFCSGALFA